MAFYHNGKVKEDDQIDPVLLMPHEDRPVEEVLSLDEAMEKGLRH